MAPFKGQIKELHLYNKILSIYDINMIYNFPNKPDWCEKTQEIFGEIQCI